MYNKNHIDKVPHKAKLLIDNKIYEIDKINFNTKQITLRESEKVYNTVLIKYVKFIFEGFNEEEKVDFEKKFL